jgi:hypothetical protein
MTKQELNELKRLAKFFWNQADLLEKDSDNRLQADDVTERSRRRAQADVYRYASTLLSMKLEQLQGSGNKKGSSPPTGPGVARKNPGR